MALGTTSRTVKKMYSNLQGEVPLDIDATVTVAASTAQGTSTYMSFITDPTQPSVTSTSLTVPPDEYWLVYDVYTPVQTPNIDGYVTFRVNSKDQNITFGPLSATYKNIFGYAELSASIMADPNSTVAARFINSVANGTAAVTDNIHVRIKRVPVGYTGKITV